MELTHENRPEEDENEEFIDQDDILAEVADDGDLPMACKAACPASVERTASLIKGKRRASQVKLIFELSLEIVSPSPHLVEVVGVALTLLRIIHKSNNF